MSSEGVLDMTTGSQPYTIQFEVWNVRRLMGEQEEHAAERRRGRDRSRQLGAPRIRSFGVHRDLAGCDEVVINLPGPHCDPPRLCAPWDGREKK
jgi:hypothetical protein